MAIEDLAARLRYDDVSNGMMKVESALRLQI